MINHWPEVTETLKNLISPQHPVHKSGPDEESAQRYASCRGRCGVSLGYPRRNRTGICIEKDNNEYLEIEFLADTIVFYRWGAGITPTFHSYPLVQPDSIDQVLRWLRKNGIKLIDNKVQQIA